LTGISFGDQAQFFRAEVLEQTGGFPAVMLMEDVEFSLRLKDAGRVLFLKNGILASGRRWQRAQFSRSILTVVYLFTRYLLERRLGKGDALNRNYYRDYYATSGLEK
jgi:GT2 family glycosyltransferase